MSRGAFAGMGATLAAFGLLVAAPLAYVVTLDVPFLRRTGVLLFGLLVLAVAAAARARARQQPLSRTAAVLVCAGTLAAAYSFFVHARLPAARAPEVGAPAPAFVARTHDGAPFDLERARTAGPVLLVFFRGFW